MHSNGIDEPIVVYNDATTTNKNWFYADHLGSIVATANTAGAATANYTYSPEGKQAGSTPIRFGYTGQQNLSGLGVQYYKARMYSADLGRFIQTDPIGMADDMNLYAYVGNDSVNGSDPSGLAAVCSGGSCNVRVGNIDANFPQPAGFPSHLSSSAANGHLYNIQVNAGTASLSGLNSGLLSSPTPGFFPRPASPQGTLNDATPQNITILEPPVLRMLNLNPVMSYQTTDNNTGAQLIINATLPSHPLYPGLVIRYVSGNEFNRVINNVGIGEGVLQSSSSPAAVRNLINNVWQGQSQGIINSVP